MATADCGTVAGARSASLPFIAFTANCVTSAGIGSATGRVAWAGSIVKQSRVNWLPAAQVPVLQASGQMAPVWYRFFQEIAERRLGGIDAPTVPDVIVQAVQTQTQVLDVQTGLVASGQQVSAITDVVNTQTVVSQESGLSGASQIPQLPRYNPKLDTGL